MPKNQVDRTIDNPYSRRSSGGASVVVSGSSGGLSGVTDHGLLTGLADDDHTQYFNQTRGDARYLLAARTLTAGAGLTGGGDLTADRTFAVGAGLGITVNADDVALTTPGTLTATSTNSASGSHTHAVTASSDVGTTPAAALLKSTAGGGLTLASLTTKGSVEVLGGGDLTVGANILFVDASGLNVGINCAPDPQFALDILGPARASYWIGPHAIQLKDVLLLAHYDGRQPFATNYSGEPNGHMGQVATVTGDLIYRPGMFGTKAAQFAEATTNLLPNPGAESNATGYGTDRVGASVSRVTDPVYIGAGAIYRTAGTSGSQNLYYTGAAALTGSTAYTFSAYLRSLNGDDISASGIQMYLDSSDGGQTPTAIVDAGDGWYRFILTRTVKASPGNAVVGFTNLPATAWYTDGWQLEAKAYATPYHSSALSVGTPSATRSASSLTYPTAGNVNAKRGTIMLWVNVDRFPTGGAGLWCAGDANTEFDAYLTAVGTVTFRINTATAVQAGTVTAGTWAHVAFTWDVAADEAKAYLNGVQVGSTGTVGGAPTLGAALYVGSLISGAVRANGLVDDFVVQDRVATAGDILAVYESAAPVFAESSRFSFRATPKSLVWADDEGLWIRNTAGDPVLGVYAGEAATKSWGGWNDMAAGDLMIGEYAGNHLRWDDSAGLLAVSGTVTATAGAIGGWVLGATSIKTSDGSAGMISDAGGPAYYAGNATPGSAPFRVYSNGNVYAAWIYGSDTGGKLSLRPAGGDTDNFYLDLTTTRSNFKLGALNVGYLLSTGTADLSLGWGRSGNGASRIRLMADATAGGADTYNAQIDRAAGANGVFSLTNTGTGALRLSNVGAAPIEFATANVVRGSISATKAVFALSDAADGYAFKQTPYGTVAVDNESTFAFTDKPLGFVMVMESTESEMALFAVRGGANAVSLVAGTDVPATWTTTKDTANKNNFYYDGTAGKYTIQNRRGSSQTYSIFMFSAAGRF